MKKNTRELSIGTVQKNKSNLKYKLLILITATGFAVSAHSKVKIASQADMLANPIPEDSSILDIESSSEGILIPRLSKSERDAIASPSHGLMIFNTSSNCINTYSVSGSNSFWYDYCITNQLMVDASIREPYLSWDVGSVYENPDALSTNLPGLQDNTARPWVIPYTANQATNDKDVNLVVDGETVWNNDEWYFTAPYAGMYLIQANYGNRLCDHRGNPSKPHPSIAGEFLSAASPQLISISKAFTTAEIDTNYPDYPAVGNSSYSRPFWVRNAAAMMTCSVPNIPTATDTVFLEEGQHIFIVGRYRNDRFDLSSWSYDNDFVNRLTIFYMVPPVDGLN